MTTFIITFKSGRAHQIRTTDFRSSDDSLWIDFLDAEETIVFRVAADLVLTVERIEETE